MTFADYFAKQWTLSRDREKTKTTQKAPLIDFPAYLPIYLDEFRDDTCNSLLRPQDRLYLGVEAIGRRGRAGSFFTGHKMQNQFDFGIQIASQEAASKPVPFFEVFVSCDKEIRSRKQERPQPEKKH